MSTQSSISVSQQEAFIPLSVPHIAGNEWVYVKECLDTGWVSSVGTFVTRFEKEVAAYHGVKHAVATVNGTAALHLALLGIGVGAPDAVIVPALTFVAPVNAVHYVGAEPIFIDAEPRHGQMDEEKLAAFIQQACDASGQQLVHRASGRIIKAIVPVNVLGHPVNMDPIRTLAERYNLKIIEDATESIGSLYKDRKAGTLGDVACLSFNGNKLLTTGGGGMLLTNDDELAAYVRYLSTQAKDDPLEYVHESVGYNYRLTNVLAAIGVAQFEQLDAYVAKKRQIATDYITAFQNLPGIEPITEAEWSTSNYWLFTVQIDESTFGMDSRALMRYLEQHNIQSRPLWRPITMLTPYQDTPRYAIEVAPKLYQKSLSIPCSVDLSTEQQTRVITTIREASLANRS